MRSTTHSGSAQLRMATSQEEEEEEEEGLGTNSWVICLEVECYCEMDMFWERSKMQERDCEMEMLGKINNETYFWINKVSNAR